MLLRAIQRKIPIPTLLISKCCPKGTTSQDRITGTTTSTGPKVNSRPSALAGPTFTKEVASPLLLKSNLSPSAIGCKMPRAPAYSGPMRCWAAAEILRSNQTVTSTPTTAEISTSSIGKGNQSSLLAPGLTPALSSRLRNPDSRSRVRAGAGAMAPIR